jgi:hypothetical protein
MQASDFRFSNPMRHRVGLRDKHVSFGRPRAAGDFHAVLNRTTGASADCVFKRCPGIGDTPLLNSHQD